MRASSCPSRPASSRTSRSPQDGLYYRERDGVVSKLVRVGFDGGAAHAVPLPFDGNLFGPTTDPDRPGALFNMQRLAAAAAPVRVRPRGGPLQRHRPDPAVEDRHVADRVEGSACHELRRHAHPAVDRLSQGHAQDGSHPTFLEGYGAYGVVLEPAFWPIVGRVDRTRRHLCDLPRARRRRVRRGLAPRRHDEDEAQHGLRLHRVRPVPRRPALHDVAQARRQWRQRRRHHGRRRDGRGGPTCSA